MSSATAGGARAEAAAARGRLRTVDRAGGAWSVARGDRHAAGHRRCLDPDRVGAAAHRRRRHVRHAAGLGRAGEPRPRRDRRPRPVVVRAHRRGHGTGGRPARRGRVGGRQDGVRRRHRPQLRARPGRRRRARASADPQPRHAIAAANEHRAAGGARRGVVRPARPRSTRRARGALRRPDQASWRDPGRSGRLGPRGPAPPAPPCPALDRAGRALRPPAHGRHRLGPRRLPQGRRGRDDAGPVELGRLVPRAARLRARRRPARDPLEDDRPHRPVHGARVRGDPDARTCCSSCRSVPRTTRPPTTSRWPSRASPRSGSSACARTATCRS